MTPAGSALMVDDILGCPPIPPPNAARAVHRWSAQPGRVILCFGRSGSAHGPRKEYNSPESLDSQTTLTSSPRASLTSFFSACAAGDVASLRDLLASEPSLVRERTAEGSTGLHLAVQHVGAVRLLLEHGADPNARDVGDNAYPLHFAGGAGGVEVVRALLDAGGDVHGVGDMHQLEVIGWATCFGATIPQDVLALLLERGARHHIFSAIAVQDAELIQRLVEENPDALSRRLSRFENGQTALHYVIAPPDGLLGGGFRTGAHYAILEIGRAHV